MERSRVLRSGVGMRVLEMQMTCSLGGYMKTHKDLNLAMEGVGMRQCSLIRMWRNQQPKMGGKGDENLQGMAENVHLLSSGEPIQHLQPFVL